MNKTRWKYAQFAAVARPMFCAIILSNQISMLSERVKLATVGQQYTTRYPCQPNELTHDSVRIKWKAQTNWATKSAVPSKYAESWQSKFRRVEAS